MGINEAGIKLVKHWEGLLLKAYKCAAGVWTIGWGHTGKVDGVAVHEGMKITEAKAEELLKKDLEQFWGYVCDPYYVPITKQLNENQKSALCSFAFNCGGNNLKTLCKNRSAAQIADALLLYNKAAGKTLDGLTQRRKAERELFNTPVTGSAPASGKKPIQMVTLRMGDTGQQVKALQKLLNELGYGLVVDGDFGTATEKAVKALQKLYKLVVDGIVGPKTWEKILG